MFGFTAIECFVIVVAIFIVMYWFLPKKALWISYLVTAFLFAVIAFKMTPDPKDDLSRYFYVLDQFRALGIDELHRYFEEGHYDWDIYRACAYYFYAISRQPNNHLLPGLTMFIVYGLMFLVIYKAGKRFNIDKLYMFLGSLFAISTYWFYDTASGIRNGLAFSIGFTCAYFYLVEQKHKILCYIGFVIAALMHSAGIMPVALVILTIITLNNSGKFMNFLLVFGLAGGGALIQYLATVTDNEMIQSLAGQAESHEAGERLVFDTTMFFVTVVTYFVVAFVMIFVSKFITEGEYADELKRFYKYCSIIMYFLVGCLYSGLIFVRFGRWIVPIIGALFFMIGMQIQKNELSRHAPSHFYTLKLSVKIRYQTRSLFMLVYFAYTCVHFWYLLAGSSTHWLTF